MAKKDTTKLTFASIDDAVAHLTAEAVALGWTCETGTGYDRDWPGHLPEGRWLECEMVDHDVTGSDVEADMRVTVMLHLQPGTDVHDRWHGFSIEGDTGYDGGTFTRRGIDTCSCELKTETKSYRRGSRWERVESAPDSHQYRTLAELLQHELERCRKAKARSATLVPVPGMGWRVPPTWFAATAETLRKGGGVTLHPHGMGTGYRLTARRQSSWDKAAPNALREKLGLPSVWLQQLDCD